MYFSEPILLIRLHETQFSDPKSGKDCLPIEMLPLDKRIILAIHKRLKNHHST